MNARQRFFLAGAAVCLWCCMSDVLWAEPNAPFTGVSVKQINVRRVMVIVGPNDVPFNMPTDVAVGPEGDVYVLDGVNDRVVIYDANGSYRSQFGSHGSQRGQFIFPLGIATGQDGKVYVADSGNRRFQIFTADGNSLDAIELPMVPSSKAPNPTDVVPDPIRPRLYIADNHIHRLAIYNLASHSFEESIGSMGTGERQFRFPFLITISDEGYVIVAEPINARVQVISPAGKFAGFLGMWGVKSGQLFRPKGVAILGNHIFISDSYLGRVQVFDLRGGFLGIVANSAGPMSFVTPTGVAVDAKNKRLYVVELKANRVCRMDLE
jgi:DNA-binding beta-propeller fold protein YncE